MSSIVRSQDVHFQWKSTQSFVLNMSYYWFPAKTKGHERPSGRTFRHRLLDLSFVPDWESRSRLKTSGCGTSRRPRDDGTPLLSGTSTTLPVRPWTAHVHHTPDPSTNRYLSVSTSSCVLSRSLPTVAAGTETGTERTKTTVLGTRPSRNLVPPHCRCLFRVDRDLFG